VRRRRSSSAPRCGHHDGSNVPSRRERQPATRSNWSWPWARTRRDGGSRPELVYGYAVGVDLTRRDVQAAMKEQGKPWDTAKGFDLPPISPIVPVRAKRIVGV
jgi:hypothetical protein